MKRRLMPVLLLVLFAPAAQAQLNVFACEPEWTALATELGGGQVNTYSATTAFQDPHRIQARPSLIARLRQADLLVCAGADLEVGWLPLLLRQSANPAVQPGKPGHVLAAMQVERLDERERVDRSMGDVHPQGNPHVHLDPRRLLPIARVLSERLQQLDPQNSEFYARRWEQFRNDWRQAMQRWQRQGRELQGLQAVVYHSGWDYLFEWLGIDNVAALEPKPGLPPSAGHLAGLKARMQQDPADVIIYSSYQSPDAARWLAERTGIAAVELPFTVGGSDAADDLYGLFDDIIRRLKGAVNQ